MFEAVALPVCGALLALLVACAFEWRHRRDAPGHRTTPRASRCPFSIRRPLLGHRDEPGNAG